VEQTDQKTRIAVFVDGSNYFYLQNILRNNGVISERFDLEKLLDYIRQFGEIVDACFYTGLDLQAEDNRQQGFVDKLPYLGFSVVTKPLKTIHDIYGNVTKQRANLDVEIVLDMFNTVQNYDMAVLISGDGDFVRPLELLRAKGKTFKILSIDETIARDLLKLAGMHYINFKDIIEHISK